MLPYKWRCCCGKNWHSYCFIAQHIGSRVDDSALPMMILILPRGLLYCSVVVVVVVMPSSQSLFMPGICIFPSKLCAYNIWYFSVDGNFRVTFFLSSFHSHFFPFGRASLSMIENCQRDTFFYHLRECNFLLIFHRNDMISSRNVYYFKKKTHEFLLWNMYCNFMTNICHHLIGQWLQNSKNDVKRKMCNESY